MNRFFVGVVPGPDRERDEVVVTTLGLRMSRQDALNLAANIVLMTDTTPGHQDFQRELNRAMGVES